MACWETVRETQTAEEREAELRAELEQLERDLRLKRVRLQIDRRGRVAFQGWRNSAGMSDICAIRKLRSKGSSAFRMALAEAERKAGRKLDERALTAGVHSHDGGRTWSPGH